MDQRESQISSLSPILKVKNSLKMKDFDFEEDSEEYKNKFSKSLFSPTNFMKKRATNNDDDRD